MLFNSAQFAIFFPIVTLGYFWLPHRFRWPLLLVLVALAPVGIVWYRPRPSDPPRGERRA